MTLITSYWNCIAKMKITYMNAYAVVHPYKRPNDVYVQVLAYVCIVPCMQNTLEERVPVWFVLDEFGSSIQHSCQPSFAMVPFYYVPKQEAYSVIWPLRDIEYGGIAMVDT